MGDVDELTVASAVGPVREYAQQIALAGDRRGQVVLRYAPDLRELEQHQVVQRVGVKISVGLPVQQADTGILTKACFGFTGHRCQLVRTPTAPRPQAWCDCSSPVHGAHCAAKA